ncbi:hypothetical protein F5884DRAFT_767455 [Xylogone sp. PMI_703]|nr:hypothetical protein F5884DRAFT_767455 [Xylogone sp. PMI_703]
MAFQPNVPVGIEFILPLAFVPPFAITFGATTLPADVALAAAVIVPASYVPPALLLVPPFFAIIGETLGAPVDLPADYVPYSPIAIPANNYPADAPLPVPVVVPPSATFPGPLTIPPLFPLAADPSQATSTTSDDDDGTPPQATQTWHYPDGDPLDDDSTLSSLANSIASAEATFTDPFTVQQASATPTAPPPSGPSGFHIVGTITQDETTQDISLAVVGSANDICTTIVNNMDKYGAYGFLGNGGDGEGLVADIMFPNYVNDSTTEFYLLEKGIIDGNSKEGPLCGVTSPSDFRLSFFSTFASAGPNTFSFFDSSGTTGTCVLNNSPSSCTDSEGFQWQVTDLMICVADGNPSYCAGH